MGEKALPEASFSSRGLVKDGAFYLRFEIKTGKILARVSFYFSDT